MLINKIRLRGYNESSNARNVTLDFIRGLPFPLCCR